MAVRIFPGRTSPVKAGHRSQWCPLRRKWHHHRVPAEQWQQLPVVVRNDHVFHQRQYGWPVCHRSGLSFQTSAQIPSMAPEALLSTLLSGSDTLASSGSAGAALFGYGGNDTLSGGAGIDTAIYHGSRANYVITKTATGYQITDTRGTEGADTLKNVERLKFYDSKVALDLEPAYGRAAQTPRYWGRFLGQSPSRTSRMSGRGSVCSTRA